MKVWTPVVAIALCLVVTPIVWGSSESPPAASVTPEIPQPPLEGLEPAVRELLTATREALLAAVDGGTASTEELADLYGHTGMVFHAHHSFEVAEVCYRRASELAAKELSWPYYLGYLYQDTGRFGEAASSYRAVLALEPEDPLANLRLGEVLLSLNELLEAEPYLKVAAGVDGLQAASEAGLGKIEMAKGNLEAAVQHYRRALELQPDANQLHYPLSLALRKLDRIEEAKAEIAKGGKARVSAHDRRLTEIGTLTASSEMFMTSGARAIKAGKLDSAATAFRGAIAARPSNARAHLNLAVVLRQLGDLEAAERSARKALELQPDYFFAHFNLGEILEAREDVAGAKAEYQEALAIDSRHIKANERVAALHMRAGEFEEAAKHYEVVVELAPSLPTPRYLLALAYVGVGETQRAHECVEEALLVNPGDARLQEAMVRLVAVDSSANASDIERALKVAIEQQKETASFGGAEALAMVLAAAQRFDEAVRLQERLIAQLPSSARPAVVELMQSNLRHYQAGERAVIPWPEE
ncbi:MAG: tetratricopeptide repeat protein [Thermoanaerobaculia bacterium]|nr:tetratricopeptide repeat protein [Thermoanaerobaculia bacterium]